MVSCDTCIHGSWAYSSLRKAEICSGDQRRLSPASTSARSRRWRLSLLDLGRHPRRRAASSASAARYVRRPPLRATSREIDEAALPIRRPIARHECSAAKPREISSRSVIVNSRLDLVRGRGRTPPVTNNNRRTVSGPRLRRLAIIDSDSPLARRSQISAFSASVTVGPPIAHLLGRLSVFQVQGGGASTP